MNSNRLAKFYGSLSPSERLPLVVMACARGDSEERDRLVNSAPRIWLRVPDYDPHARALEHLSHLYVMRQLELLLVCMQLFGNSLCSTDSPADNAHGRDAARLFIANIEAWNLVCSRLGLNVDDVTAKLPGALAISRATGWLAVMAGEYDHARDSQDVASEMLACFQNWSSTR